MRTAKPRTCELHTPNGGAKGLVTGWAIGGWIVAPAMQRVYGQGVAYKKSKTQYCIYHRGAGLTAVSGAPSMNKGIELLNLALDNGLPEIDIRMVGRVSLASGEQVRRYRVCGAGKKEREREFREALREAGELLGVGLVEKKAGFLWTGD